MTGKEYIEIEGIGELINSIDKLSTRNIDKDLKKIIRAAISEARRKVSKDAKSILANDKRRAYKAVRQAVYKKILGGQINILASKRAGQPVPYDKERTLKDGQRGGNRIPRSARTEKMDSYFGKDRGFILRFVNSGTAQRTTRYGNRGSIDARDWFGSSSNSAIQSAAENMAENIERAVVELWKKE